VPKIDQKKRGFLWIKKKISYYPIPPLWAILRVRLVSVATAGIKDETA
jgi:hypothetical protein